MAIENYGDLKQVVADMLHNSDITDQQFDSSMDSAVSQINTKFVNSSTYRSELIQEPQRVYPESPDYYVGASASGFREIISILTGDIDDFGGVISNDINNPTLLNGPATARRLLASGNATRVRPSQYTVPESQGIVRFNTVPPEDSNFLVVYRAWIQTFTNDLESNIILDFYPNQYIYGMCAWLTLHSQDIEMSALFQQRFDEEVANLNEEYARGNPRGPAQIVGASSWV